MRSPTCSVLALAVLLAGCATTGLRIHAEGHPTTARAGTTDEAALVLAVNSDGGPVVGLGAGNFQTHAGPVAAGGCYVEITRVVSNLDGRYLLDIVPITSNPTCEWKAGRYVIAVLVTDGAASGVGVTDLTIEP